MKKALFTGKCKEMIIDAIHTLRNDFRDAYFECDVDRCVDIAAAIDSLCEQVFETEEEKQEDLKAWHAEADQDARIIEYREHYGI